VTAIAGVVPAKGNSSRLPGKNLKGFGGLPLFLNAAEHLARVLPRDQVFVDTEDFGIAKAAEKAGFGVLHRSKELASNDTSGIQLMKWEMEQLPQFDVFVQHFPTMPFLSRKTLEALIHAVSEDGFDSAFGLHASQDYLWSDPTEPMYPIDRLPNSVDLPTTFRECMGIYVTRKEAFLKWGNRVCGSFKTVNVDQFEMVDIDTQEDLDVATAIARGLPAQNEYFVLNNALKGPAPRIVFLDVDGTLTNGDISLDSAGRMQRTYSTLDGLAVSLAAKKVPVVFLTAAVEDQSIESRAKMLGVDMVRYNSRDKASDALQICALHGVDLGEALFVGNDSPDMELLKQVGFAYVPSDSGLNPTLRTTKLTAPGGYGAVREALLLSGLLSAQDIGLEGIGDSR
jgi:YrbI family 3-deoxy-D-manno-octulosonate 8-phosphate phosphatase